MKRPVLIYGGIVIAIFVLFRLVENRRRDVPGSVESHSLEITSDIRTEAEIPANSGRGSGVSIGFGGPSREMVSVNPKEAEIRTNIGGSLSEQSLLFTNAAELGHQAGSVRKKKPPLSDADILFMQRIIRALRNRQLSEEEFVDFQSAFMAAALSLADSEKTRRIRELIYEGRQEARKRHLKPPPQLDTTGARKSEWDLLDRRVSKQVEKLLSENEREEFIKSFGAVLEIDIGLSISEE